MTRKYDAVILDLDGTLLDTLEDLADAVNFALRSAGMPERTLREIRDFVGNGVRRLLEQAVPEGADHPRFDEVFGKFREYYALHCNDKTKPYEGILPLLKELKAEGYALAIVSNKLDSAVKELAEIYFEDLIPVAIGEREGVARKPAPDTVFAALKELEVTADRAVYVGDSEVDVMTARNAGLPCITVLWGFRDREVLEACGADTFAQTPEEIMSHLVG